MATETVRTFPISPKSNASIEPGDFWPLELPDGVWAAGVVLRAGVFYPGARERSSFVAGVPDWTSDNAPTQSALAGARAVVGMWTMNIKEISRHGQAIVGQIDVTQLNVPAFRDERGVTHPAVGPDPHAFEANDRPPHIAAGSPGTVWVKAAILLGGLTADEAVREYTERFSASSS